MKKGNVNDISIIFIIKKIYKHIDQKSIKRLYLFVISSIICGFLEVINLFSFSLLLNNLSGNNNNLNYICNTLITFISNVVKNDNIQFYVSLIFFLIITLLTSFARIYNLKLRFGTAASIGNLLSSKAYWLTINQPYSKFLETNSSDSTIVLSRYIYETVSVLNGLAAFVSSVMIILSIVISLFIINTLLTTIIFISLIISYYLIFGNQRKNLLNNSSLIEKYSGLQVKNIQETFGSIKDIILYGTEEIEYKNYKNIDQKMRYAESRNFFLVSSPRVVMEAIALSLMSLIVLFLFTSGINESKLITLVGSFALGAQRMLPAFNMIYSSLANIKGNAFSLFKVIKYLEKNNKVSSFSIKTVEPLFLENSITLKDASFSYFSNPEKNIIENLNLEIKKGENIGIVGSTGSGKSTLLNILMTLLEPTNGSLLIDGIDINENITKLKAWRKNIAHIPQLVYLSDASIRENITFQTKDKVNQDLLDEVCEAALLDKFINNLPFGLDTYAGERGIRFSGGQLQRLAIARALYKNGNVYIFDEATSSLDLKTEAKIISNFDKIPKKKTIITVAHRLDTLRNCDYWILLREGSVQKINNFNDLYNL